MMCEKEVTFQLTRLRESGKLMVHNLIVKGKAAFVSSTKYVLFNVENSWTMDDVLVVLTECISERVSVIEDDDERATEGMVQAIERGVEEAKSNKMVTIEIDDDGDDDSSHLIVVNDEDVPAATSNTDANTDQDDVSVTGFLVATSYFFCDVCRKIFGTERQGLEHAGVHD